MQDENELVKLAQSGDREAFNTLVQQCTEKIYNLAFQLTGNSADAEDLSQNAFLNAYKNISRFKYKCSFSTWMYRITVNLWKDRTRYEKRRSLLRYFSLDKRRENEDYEFAREISDTIPDPAAEIEKAYEQNIVQKLLDELDTKERIMIVLHDIEGKSYREISGILGCSIRMIKSKIAHARKLLRRKVTKYFGGRRDGL